MDGRAAASGVEPVAAAPDDEGGIALTDKHAGAKEAFTFLRGLVAGKEDTARMLDRINAAKALLEFTTPRSGKGGDEGGGGRWEAMIDAARAETSD